MIEQDKRGFGELLGFKEIIGVLGNDQWRSLIWIIVVQKDIKPRGLWEYRGVYSLIVYSLFFSQL